jgi:hypothetical protein
LNYYFGREKLIMLTTQPNMLTRQQHNGSLRLGPCRRISAANRQICEFEGVAGRFWSNKKRLRRSLNSGADSSEVFQTFSDSPLNGSTSFEISTLFGSFEGLPPPPLIALKDQIWHGSSNGVTQ